MADAPSAAYALESRALDAEIAGAIDAWHRHGTVLSDERFDDLALRLLRYQLRYNAPYARYCATFGVTPSALPSSWMDVPPVPAAAFKEAVVATFDSSRADLVFETSGTTTGSGGRHFFETRAIYDAALLAGFDRFMLPDGARLHYFNLVPNPVEVPQSSLGYMMGTVSRKRGIASAGWYVSGGRLAYEAFFGDLREAVEARRPVCVAATAFALVHVLDRLKSSGRAFVLPPGSRLMETGGFKGRARNVRREELYERLCRAFGIGIDCIVSEYGMTELTSQYYDDVLVAGGRTGPNERRKCAPPWLRTRVVGPDGTTLARGTVGALVHVDLANRASCIAIATEDLGVQFDAALPGDPPALLLIGRERGAALRGCSLDAESLLPVESSRLG